MDICRIHFTDLFQLRNSYKCSQCGLVNFSTAIQCKRCNQNLNELTPITNQRIYQNTTSNLQSYQNPPPPPVFNGNQFETTPKQNQPMDCIKCGQKNNLKLQTFKKNYIPPSIYGAAIAPLLYLILVAIFKVTHHITAPFCDGCWSKFKNGKIAEIVGGALGLVLVIGAVPAFVVFDSIIIFMVCFISSIIIFVIGHSYKEATSPKFKTVDKNQVIIVSPVAGEICFQK